MECHNCKEDVYTYSYGRHVTFFKLVKLLLVNSCYIERTFFLLQRTHSINDMT